MQCSAWPAPSLQLRAFTATSWGRATDLAVHLQFVSLSSAWVVACMERSTRTAYVLEMVHDDAALRPFRVACAAVHE